MTCYNACLIHDVFAVVVVFVFVVFIVVIVVHGDDV